MARLLPVHVALISGFLSLSSATAEDEALQRKLALLKDVGRITSVLKMPRELEKRLKEEPRLVTRDYGSGRTLLHLLTLSGDLAGVKVAIEQGCRLDVKDDGGRSCLHDAVVGSHYDLIRFFLDKGLSPDDPGNPRAPNSPLDAAVGLGDFEAYSILTGSMQPGEVIKPSGSFSILSRACSAGRVEERIKIIDDLMKRGVALNQRDGTGETPLTHAVRMGDPDVVAYLLTLPGIDIELPGRGKSRPLHIAAARYAEARDRLDQESRLENRLESRIAVLRTRAVNRARIVITFLKAGAGSSAKDAFEKTPKDYLGSEGVVGVHCFVSGQRR